MYIKYIGYNHIHDMDFNIERPNGSGDYLAIITKSYGSFILNNEEVIVKPNTFILYKEGTPQFFHAYKEPFSHDWFHFKLEDGEEDYFQNLHIPFECPINLTNSSILSLIITNIANEKYDFKYNSDAIIENFMNIFFLKISQEIKYSEVYTLRSHYDKLEVLRSKIYSKPSEKWTINSLAKEVSLSPYYFQRLYKKSFGISCMKDVINARMESAKYYLTQTDLNIKDIAVLNGYENTEHFMRQFKQSTGYTPGSYRKQYTKS